MIVRRMALLGKDSEIVELPVGFNPIFFAMQHGLPTLWYEEPIGPPQTAMHEVVGVDTGERFTRIGGRWRHLGTTITPGGSLARHFYINTERFGAEA